MPGLVDIIKLTEDVDIRGVMVRVRGVGVNKIAEALATSQETQKLLAGVQLAAPSLLQAIPNTIARVVAYAIVSETVDLAPLLVAPVSPADLSAPPPPYDPLEANIEAFNDLDADAQLLLVEAVIRVSFPGGISPFFERLGKLAGQGNVFERLAQYGKGLRTSSPQRLMN